MEVETITVKSKDGHEMVINAADFDSSIHQRTAEESAPLSASATIAAIRKAKTRDALTAFERIEREGKSRSTVLDAIEKQKEKLA